MTILLQQGKTKTIQLKFLNSDGITVAPAPSSGGSVSGTGANLLTVSLASDQQTVTITGKNVGTDAVNYSGPGGLTASDPVHVVATTATSATFDETTLMDVP